MMACAARVGSDAARRAVGAVGFVGTSTAATARHFDLPSGVGTMPHALVGYAGSTLRSAEMFHEAFPDEPLTVLVDYYAQEVSDSLAVAARFPELAAADRLAVRIDTHGGRFVEGLDTASSYAVLERHAPEAIRTYRTETELRWLVGTGVSAAAVFHLRDALDAAGHGVREDRRQLRLRSRQVPADGGGPGADRYRRHRLVPAGALVGNLCGGRRHRLRRPVGGQGGARVPAARPGGACRSVTVRAAGPARRARGTSCPRRPAPTSSPGGQPNLPRP